MLVRDPTSQKVSYIGRNKNTVSVRQAVALQSGLGGGGMLNRDFSRASGIKQQNTIQNSNYSRPISSAQRDVAKFTKDKRPVSSHINLRARMGIASIQSAKRTRSKINTNVENTLAQKTFTNEG